MVETIKPEKLVADNANARAAGLSYGQWMALNYSPDQQKNVAMKEKDDGLDLLNVIWRTCEHCGKDFYQTDKKFRKYCSIECKLAAGYRRKSERKRNEMLKALDIL